MNTLGTISDTTRGAHWSPSAEDGKQVECVGMSCHYKSGDGPIFKQL